MTGQERVEGEDHQDVDEFMGELRLALPGAQVLFAFLLTVPFSARFPAVSDVDQSVYFVALLSAAAASVLLIAPSALRQFLPQSDIAHLRPLATRLAMTGLGLLGLALASSLYLVADIVYGPAVAVTVGTSAAVLAASTWYLLPAMKRRRNRRRAKDQTA